MDINISWKMVTLNLAPQHILTDTAPLPLDSYPQAG
jgi:hypothetical protein